MSISNASVYIYLFVRIWSFVNWDGAGNIWRGGYVLQWAAFSVIFWNIFLVFTCMAVRLFVALKSLHEDCYTPLLFLSLWWFTATLNIQILLATCTHPLSSLVLTVLCWVLTDPVAFQIHFWHLGVGRQAGLAIFLVSRVMGLVFFPFFSLFSEASFWCCSRWFLRWWSMRGCVGNAIFVYVAPSFSLFSIIQCVCVFFCVKLLFRILDWRNQSLQFLFILLLSWICCDCWTFLYKFVQAGF